MKTLQQELDKLTKKYEEDVGALRKMYSILDAVRERVSIDDYHPPFIHLGKLRTIAFRGTEYSLREGKTPDASLLKDLMIKFPWVPVLKVKDGGCTSFHPESEIGKRLAFLADCYECGPVTIGVCDIEHGAKAVFRWFSEVNGDLYKFEVKFPLHKTRIGVLDAKAKHYGGEGGPISSWEKCEFIPDQTLNAQKIRWASGGPQYANSFTLFWDRDTGNEIDYAGLVIG